MMAGLLDTGTGMDLNGLLAQFQPSDADRAAAQKMAQLQFFLGMLGARKGFELQQIGQSGVNAVQGYQNTLKQEQALRSQNVQTLLPLLQLAQRQKMVGELSNAFSNASQPTPVNTTLPAGSVGGTGMGGGTAATFGPGTQPGPVTGPTANVPAYQADPSARLRLAQLSARAKMAGLPDISPDIKLMFPDPVRVNAGGGIYNPLTGTMQMTPKSIEGSQLVQQPDGSWNYAPVGNAPSAMALPKVVSELAERATAPQMGVLPGGGQGVVGTELGALGGANPNGPYAFLNNLFANGVPQAASSGATTPTPTATQPTQPTAPVQTKLSPEQEANSKALGEQASDYRAAMDQSSKAIAQLDQIGDTLKYFTPGPTLPMRAKVAGYAQEVPGVGRSVADFFVPNSQTALPAIAAMEKFGVGLTAEQSKVFGSREGQQVIGMIKSAMPNAEQVPGAPETIIEAQKGVHQWIIDKGHASQAWLADPSHHGSLDGFSDAWDTAHPVSSYVGNLPALQRLANGQPPGQPSGQTPSPQTTKTVIRTGTYNGRRVVQYSDGTTAYTQ